MSLYKNSGMTNKSTQRRLSGYRGDCLSLGFFGVLRASVGG